MFQNTTQRKTTLIRVIVYTLLACAVVATGCILLHRYRKKFDIEICEQMNAALLTHTVSDGAAENVVEAKQILTAVGFGDSISPKQCRAKYYWHSVGNQVYLIYKDAEIQCPADNAEIILNAFQNSATRTDFYDLALDYILVSGEAVVTGESGTSDVTGGTTAEPVTSDATGDTTAEPITSDTTGSTTAEPTDTESESTTAPTEPPQTQPTTPATTAEHGAEVDGKQYDSVVEAIEDAEPGQTVVLKEDLETETPIELDKPITIDLNGKEVRHTCSDRSSAFNITSNDVTIQNGSIVSDGRGVTCSGGSANLVNCNVTANEQNRTLEPGSNTRYYAIGTDNGGDLNIDGGSFVCQTGDTVLDVNSHSCTVGCLSALIATSGGSIRTQNAEYVGDILVDGRSANSAKFIIESGSFEGDIYQGIKNSDMTNNPLTLKGKKLGNIGYNTVYRITDNGNTVTEVGRSVSQKLGTFTRNLTILYENFVGDTQYISNLEGNYKVTRSGTPEAYEYEIAFAE